MRVHEVFVYHKQTGNNLFAAIAAADIAYGKSSRVYRSSWLDEVRVLRPDWGAAIDMADMVGNFDPLYSLIRKALKDAGREAKEVWDIAP